MTNLPAEIYEADGIIELIAKYTLAISSRKHPEFALAAGLATVSVVCGRKVVDETATTANLYLLSLGPTGCGKDSYRKGLKNILQPFSFLSSERFTSDSAFVNELMEKPSMLAVSDEIGAMIEDLNSVRTSQLSRNLCDAMVQCYTAAGSVWNFKGFADKSRTKMISHPNFVLHGSGNGTTFFKSLRPEEVSSGFLGRFTMFLSANGGGHCDNLATLAKDRDNPGDDEYSPLLSPPQEISDFIQKWTARDEHAGNLEAEFPEPKIISRTAEAARRLDDHFRKIHEKNASEYGSVRGDLWARASEKTAKFALLHALSRSADKIEICDADWGIALSNFLVRRFIEACGQNIAESPWDSKRISILRRIREHGRPIEHSKILKASKIKRREFIEFIESLSECGDIVTTVRQTSGRAGIGYAASNVDISKFPDWQIVTAEMVEASRARR